MDNLIIYAIPIFGLTILVESLVAYKKNKSLYEQRDTLTCLAMGLGNVLIAGSVKGLVLMGYYALYELRIFDLAATWWVWILLIFSEDFCYYWFHRAHHESRFFWAAHINHHSSQHYNLAVALRQSWTTPLTGFIFWLPLPLLGFHPLMILTAQAISLLYQYWIHTQLIGKLGPLEWILNTPSHHRVHHGANPEYIDKNFAGIFIIWDRLFGSFAPEKAPVKYGLTKNITRYNPFYVAFHAWHALWLDLKKATNWGDRLRLLFKRPGWVPKS